MAGKVPGGALQKKKIIINFRLRYLKPTFTLAVASLEAKMSINEEFLELGAIEELESDLESLCSHALSLDSGLQEAGLIEEEEEVEEEEEEEEEEAEEEEEQGEELKSFYGNLVINSKMGGARKSPHKRSKSFHTAEITYFTQLAMLFILSVACIINLSLQIEPIALWVSMLSHNAGPLQEGPRLRAPQGTAKPPLSRKFAKK